MDNKSIDIVNSQTNTLYKKYSKDFSKTRSLPWKGWLKLVDILVNNFYHRDCISLLDIGCGNLRFEKFLEKILPNIQIECSAVDNCPDLLGKFKLHNTIVNYLDLDIIEGLKSNHDFLPKNQFDLVVLFGLMHHIPGFINREKLIDYSVCKLKCKGLFVVSFWQFMKDERLAKKALKTTAEACKKMDVELDENDYFLNWGNDEDCYRFCHNFSDLEVDSYINHAITYHNASVVTDFYCDGVNNNLNRYLVFSI